MMGEEALFWGDIRSFLGWLHFENRSRNGNETLGRAKKQVKYMRRLAHRPDATTASGKYGEST